MSQNNNTEIDAYELAALAAHLMSRQSSPSSAVETAYELIQEAEHKLEGVRLKAAEPELRTELEKLREEELANLHLKYENGVKLITGVDRWPGTYGALNWFKRFLQWKAEKRETTTEGAEARVEAWLLKYRVPGFMGTEAKNLREEFEAWRNKGKQGRVKKKVRDGRLKGSRQRKARQKAKQAWEKFNKKPRSRSARPKLEFVPDIEAVGAMKQIQAMRVGFKG
jgi:hypothetical protein